MPNPTEPKPVTVARVMVSVTVAIPGNMSADMFDNIMEDNYGAILERLDVRDALITALTDQDGPLEGYEVDVVIT